MKKQLKYKLRRTLLIYIPFIVFWTSILVHRYISILLQIDKKGDEKYVYKER